MLTEIHEDFANLMSKHQEELESCLEIIDIQAKYIIRLQDEVVALRKITSKANKIVDSFKGYIDANR